MKLSELTIITEHKPCADGLLFAKAQPSLEAIWNNCERPDWLFWLLERLAPLSQGVAVRISVATAERSLANFENIYADDKRPRLAIEAAKAFAENPTEENRLAARSASAWAAWSAESAAWSAAWSSAWSSKSAAAAAEAAESAARSARSVWSARSAESAESAVQSARSASAWAAWSAESAAWSAEGWSAAWSAENKWQCDLIRSLVANPLTKL